MRDINDLNKDLLLAVFHILESFDLDLHIIELLFAAICHMNFGFKYAIFQLIII